MEDILSAIKQRIEGFNPKQATNSLLAAIDERVRQFLPSETVVVGNKRTGPGFDQPMLQPGAQAPQIAASPSPTPTATPSPNGVQGFTTWAPPPELSNMIVSSAQQRNIHPAVLAAVLQNESGIDPRVRDNISLMEDGRKSRDRGIAQISDIWHPNVTDAQAYDPNFAINYAADLLASNYRKYNNWEQAVAGYNVGNRVGLGEGRDARGLGPKGRQYLKRVTKNIDPTVLQELGFSGLYDE